MFNRTYSSTEQVRRVLWRPVKSQTFISTVLLQYSNVGGSKSELVREQHRGQCTVQCVCRRRQWTWANIEKGARIWPPNIESRPCMLIRFRHRVSAPPAPCSERQQTLGSRWRSSNRHRDFTLSLIRHSLPTRETLLTLCHDVASLPAADDRPPKWQGP